MLAYFENDWLKQHELLTALCCIDERNYLSYNDIIYALMTSEVYGCLDLAQSELFNFNVNDEVIRLVETVNCFLVDNGTKHKSILTNDKSIRKHMTFNIDYEILRKPDDRNFWYSIEVTFNINGAKIQPDLNIRTYGENNLLAKLCNRLSIMAYKLYLANHRLCDIVVSTNGVFKLIEYDNSSI